MTTKPTLEKAFEAAIVAWLVVRAVRLHRWMVVTTLPSKKDAKNNRSIQRCGGNDNI